MKNLFENTFDLRAIFDSRQCFYGKAIVEIEPKTQKINLYSYQTKVCTLDHGKVNLLDCWDCSNTTLRHTKEFLKQYGFKAETKAQMRKDYIG